MILISIDSIATEERIKTLSIAKGLNPRMIADELGLATVNSVYRWYKGETIPSLDNLVLILVLFNCKFEDLIVIKKL